MEKKDYIFGLRAIIEALDAGKDIDKVLLRKGLQGDLARELLARIRETDTPVQWAPVEKLNRITMKNHQGAIAMLSAVTYYPLDHVVQQLFEEGGTPLLLVLDSLTDTRNFGAIARTAECAGVDAIVIPDHGSVSVNSDAVKTSAGALLTLPVCRVRNLAEAVDYLKNSGIQVVGASEKASESFVSPDYTLPTAIVMGAEDVGISEPVLKRCDTLVSIPILGNIGSLNVSVATGIVLYQAVMNRIGTGMSVTPA